MVGPPSVRLGKAYEVTDLTAPSDIPPSLVAWLLEGHATKAPKKAAVVRQVSVPQTKHYNEEAYQYGLDDKRVWEILDQLPEEFLTDYTKWLTVTTVLKRHTCHSIWQEWCKRGGNYNEKQNESCWLSVKPILDINYLEWIVARAGGREVQQVTKFKPYEPIEKGLKPGWQSVCGSTRFVSELLSRETFEHYETIAIRPCTGTGKTTAIARLMEEGDSYTKFLSIVTRTSLADQHSKSFANIGITNYQDVKHGLCDVDRLVICLNSIGRLDVLDDSEMSEYVVYIDEVTSLLEFTGKDLLDNVMTNVVVTLTRLIKPPRASSFPMR